MFSPIITNHKRLIFNLLFLLFFLPCYSQNLNTTDDQGRKQGVWSKNYDNGKKRFKGSFKDDYPIDSFTYWHENGNLKAEMFYFNEGKQCHVFLYNTNGKHVADGYYYEQVKDSLWRYFNDANGIRVAEEFYRKDIPHGKWIIFYEDGKTPSEIQVYVNGKKEGEQTTYFENGQLKEKWFCRHSIIDGEITYYHPNGKIRGTGQYENDLPVGIWTYYNEDGKMTVKDYYEKGEVIKTEDFEKTIEQK